MGTFHRRINNIGLGGTRMVTADEIQKYVKYQVKEEKGIQLDLFQERALSSEIQEAPPLVGGEDVTIVLSLIGWTGLARVVRGKLLALREEDFTMAAKVAGCKDMRIISRHLLPGFLSYIIVQLTLSIPNMILGETSLSFLGLGLRPPITSWGVLLKAAQNVRTVALHPWLMIPVLFVITTVLAFNFLGDGLRDAADPYH